MHKHTDLIVAIRKFQPGVRCNNIKPISYKRGRIQIGGFLADGTNQDHLSRWLNTFTNIYGDDTRFLFVLDNSSPKLPIPLS